MKRGEERDNGAKWLLAGGKVQGGIDRLDKVDRRDEKTGRAKRHTATSRRVRVEASLRECVRSSAAVM